MHPYLELSKARLTSLVLLSTAAGFVLAGREHAFGLRLLWTLLGTGLAAAGANALNQWIEVWRDAQMDRTRHRPLPTGQLTRTHALTVGLVSATTGVAVLLLLVNPLTGGLGAFVVLLYTLAYTPLKHRTPFCTLVGAICGAIPPMMGWSGASGALRLGAWILFATLFLWQIPHFLSLAWLYRRDYARGGFKMLPSLDPSGRLTAAFAVIYSAALLPVSCTALFAGLAGWTFLVGSMLLGGGLLVLGLRLQRERSERSARRLFLGSLLYLPLLLGLMVADRGPARRMEPIAVVQVEVEGGPPQPVLPAPAP